jgi:hypothetical protein
MILSSACQPWPADHPGPGRKSSATTAVSYTTEWDTIVHCNSNSTASNISGCLSGLFNEQITNDDPRALFHITCRDGAPDATRTTRDNRNLVPKFHL